MTKRRNKKQALMASILSLVLYLWSKQRIREVGIYRSLGYSKCEIRLQFLAESTIVASAACLSALPASLLICLVSQIALPGLLSVIGVLFVVFVVSGFSILTATYPLLRMHPRQIFTQLS